MSTFDIIIIILFIAGILIGYKRGFVLQIIHLAGFFVAYLVAFYFYKEIAPAIAVFIPYIFVDTEVSQSLLTQVIDLESMYYNAIAFALLFFGTKISLHIIGRVIHTVTLLPGLNLINRTLGGALGFVEVFLILFIATYVLMFIPWETGQIWVSESQIAMWMTEKTPYFANHLFELWNGE